MRRPRLVPVVLLVLTAAASAAAAQVPGPAGALHVGTVLDGPSALEDSLRAEFEREIAGFFGAGGPVDFPREYRVSGDWTPAGAAAAIDHLLAAGGADLVLTLGPIGWNELARRRSLPKPAIAALIIDATMQELPVQGGASGIPNLTYVDIAYTASRTLEVFHGIVRYHRLALLAHPGLLAAIPRLRDRTEAQAHALGVAIEFVPLTGSAAAALAALPPGTDAVYLVPPDELSAAGLDSLIQAFRAAVPYLLCAVLWLPWRAPAAMTFARGFSCLLLLVALVIYGPMLFHPEWLGGDMVGLAFLLVSARPP